MPNKAKSDLNRGFIHNWRCRASFWVSVQPLQNVHYNMLERLDIKKFQIQLETTVLFVIGPSLLILSAPKGAANTPDHTLIQ